MSLNLGLHAMLAEPPTVDITTEPQQVTQPSQVQVSTESISAYYMRDRDGLLADHAYMGCGDAGCGPRRARMIPMIQKRNATTNQSEWVFFMTEFSFDVLNDFVNKLIAVKPGDKVFVHGPAWLYTDDAEVIVSALKACASQDITISSPYILNSPAAYILTAAKTIINSPACVIHFDLPTVGAGGKITDAKNSMESAVYRRMHILKGLQAAGFVTDDQISHITNNQGEVIVYGDALAGIIAKYNSTHMTQN